MFCKVRFTILLILTFLLSGCARQVAPSSSVAQSAINTATALEKTLPEECLTEPVKEQITALKTQIEAIPQMCEIEKVEIRNEKIRWQVAFFALLISIGLFVSRRFF